MRGARGEDLEIADQRTWSRINSVGGEIMIREKVNALFG
jgi:hypothetical protein